MPLSSAPASRTQIQFKPVAATRRQICWLKLAVWFGAAAISILFWIDVAKVLNLV